MALSLNGILRSAARVRYRDYTLASSSSLYSHFDSRVRKMSQQAQAQRPVTYGDAFGAKVGGDEAVAKQPITKEDAALMQSAETAAMGRTQKGGAAAVMQAAADRNVRTGAVPAGAHSPVAEEGLRVDKATVPGAVVHTEFVAGHPVAATAEEPPPVNTGLATSTAQEAPPVNAGLDTETVPLEVSDVVTETVPIGAAEPVTVGEALEAAALGAGDEPVLNSDARAVQSAETRVTGRRQVEKGGVGATAQSAAAANQLKPPAQQTTLSDVLTDASAELPRDKLATREDAERVTQAELRGRPLGSHVRLGGVADCVQAAADVNESLGVTR